MYIGITVYAESNYISTSMWPSIERTRPDTIHWYKAPNHIQTFINKDEEYFENPLKLCGAYVHARPLESKSRKSQKSRENKKETTLFAIYVPPIKLSTANWIMDRWWSSCRHPFSHGLSTRGCRIISLSYNIWKNLWSFDTSTWTYIEKRSKLREMEK